MANYDRGAKAPSDNFFAPEESALGAQYDSSYESVPDPDPDIKDIKEAVGEAISGIPGVLALKGGLADIFKKDEDLTRGIAVHRADGDCTEVKVKVIGESGYDAAELVREMTDAITEALRARMGLRTCRVDADVDEVLTLDDFHKLYDEGHALH